MNKKLQILLNQVFVTIAVMCDRTSAYCMNKVVNDFKINKDYSNI